MAGLPNITFPDFETLVLDRLLLCYQDIGITAFRQPPINALPLEQFPVVYTLTGAMLNAIPLDTVGAGGVIVNRTYVARLLGSPLPSTTDQSATAGAQGFVDIAPYFNRFRQYFLGHPRLQTTTLDALAWVYQDITFTDSGIVSRPAPGGVDHFAIDFSIAVYMRAPVTRLG